MGGKMIRSRWIVKSLLYLVVAAGFGAMLGLATGYLSMGVATLEMAWKGALKFSWAMLVLIVVLAILTRFGKR